MTTAITVGAGRDRPRGTRQILRSDISLPRALHRALVELPDSDESWWSSHVFRGDYRLGDNWEASIAVVVDADRVGHTAWDAASWAALLSAMLSMDIPGSLAHPTPHGARIVFPFAEPVTDRAAWKGAARGACRLMGDALDKLPELGLEVDTGASCDLARFFFGPHATVGGVQRTDQVFSMRDCVWSVEELVAHAPAEQTEKKRAEPVADEILPNDRHEALMRLAASLRAKGLKRDEIYAALREVNERRCKPPKPDAEIWALADYFDKKDGPNLGQGERFPLTDLGNAQRLVARHGQDLRYCFPLKSWFVWDGKRWKKDATGEAMRRAKETILSLYHEASLNSDGGSTKLAAHAIASEKADRLRAMIELASSESGIAVLPEDLDSNSWVLNVENGTIDLKTGTLLPHRREDLITRLAPVCYDPEASDSTWDAFLERMVPDPAVRSFVQRGVGYTLTGDTSEEVLFFVHGPTNAGKSTFTEAVKAAIGDYAVTADFEAFLRRREPGIRNDIARMAGARMVLSLEVEEGRRLAVATIKSLTGGDTVTARFLHKEFFEFRPTFKPWLVANHKPAANAADSALWRRILVVPFTTELPKSERDPRVKKTLLHSPASRAAILAWAVMGCLAWQKDGIGAPPAVRNATESYRKECDALERFISEQCVLRPDARVAADDLYSAYKTWCEEEDETPLAQQGFGKELTKKEIGRKRGTGGRGVRIGIALSDRSDPGDPQFSLSSLESPLREKTATNGSLGSLRSLDGDALEAAEERAAIMEVEAGRDQAEAEGIPADA